MCFVAAVASLAKFGASCDELLDSVIVLLDRYDLVTNMLGLLGWVYCPSLVEATYLPSVELRCVPLLCVFSLCRCLLDNDNEVRDRAILYLEVLKKQQKSLSTQYILSGEIT